MKEIIDIAVIAALVASPFLAAALVWGIVAWIVGRRKKRCVAPPKVKVSPPYIARRVMYATELRYIKATVGDLAYVLKENNTYMYDGHHWVKVEKKDGTVGN